MLRQAAMWMSSQQPANAPSFPMVLSSRSPKRDLLLCVARRYAVTLTRNAPLFKAQGPGLSVSSTEPSGGVLLSWFCMSSSRSLGRCLRLGQRSRLNFLSDLIGSLVHQDYREAHTEFSGHRHNGHPRSEIARMGSTHRAEKLSQLIVLAERRPGGLNELASEPCVSCMSDRSSIGLICGRVLGRHQAQKSPQLANVFKLSPIPDAGQKLTGHDPADPRDRHQILDALRQL